MLSCCHLVTVVGVNASCDWTVTQRHWTLLLCLATDYDDTGVCQCHKALVTLQPWQKVWVSLCLIMHWLYDHDNELCLLH